VKLASGLELIHLEEDEVEDEVREYGQVGEHVAGRDGDKHDGRLHAAVLAPQLHRHVHPPTAHHAPALRPGRPHQRLLRRAARLLARRRLDVGLGRRRRRRRGQAVRAIVL